MTQQHLNFNDVMRLQPEASVKLPELVDPATMNAAEQWHAAIAGKGAQIGLADTQKAAASWLAVVDSTPPSYSIR